MGGVEKFANIVKPLEDKREYLGLKLSNQLNVLLISDPETDISAAALSVHVGSMLDPFELQGLAHFLEHMLFMGTKKYPSENEYSKFLSQHGGSSNAYTSETNTNFFFDVAPEYLQPSLDRFAQFFIDPLMLEDSVSRELEAVHSEFQKNLDNDSWRVMQISKVISDPKHDYYKFSIGNLQTLRDEPNSKGINVREELFKFHKQWYSANNMCLCVLGKEPLDQLAEMVETLFTPIENKNITPKKWTQHPYTEKSLMKKISVVPVKDKRQMSFIFVYPDEVEHYQSGPGNYLSQLIGHEGKGSLLSELKERGLVSSLMSYFDSVDGFGFFHISVDLTEDALNRIDEVAQVVFQYIHLLKTEGPKEYVFEEEKRLGYIRFHFMEKSNPIDYVQKLASQMHYFPLEHTLSANILVEKYNPELITEMLAYLKPEHCTMVITSKTFEGQTDLKEHFFGTNYKVEPFSAELIESLKNSQLNDRLKFPEPNEFIPTNFDLLKTDEADAKLPTLIKNTDLWKTWYLKDDIYHRPKVFYGIKLLNPVMSLMPQYVNATSLFCTLFKDAMTEFLYTARLAGLSFDMYSVPSLIKLEFYGYNHKMDIFMERVIEKLIEYKICPKRFEILKEKYCRSLRNYKTFPLYQLSNYYQTLNICELSWSYEELINSLNALTIESVERIRQEIFSSFQLESFFHGNVGKDATLKLCQLIEDKLVAQYHTIPLSDHSYSNLREVVLEPSCFYRYEAVIDIQVPKAVNVYYQIGYNNQVESSKCHLVSQLLQEPCFDVLRTKEQLGYVVFSKYRESSGVFGMIFIIQSDYSPAYLDDRIEAFLLWAENYIREMSEQEFEDEKKSLLTKLLKKKKRLYYYSSQLWTEIIKNTYNFKYNELIAEEVRKLTKEDILQFFKKYLSIESPLRKKLSVRIIKSNPELNTNKPPETEGLLPAPPTKESTLITDFVEFKKRRSLHPIPLPKVDIINNNNNKAVK